MGVRVRAFDWSRTPLGPIEGWSSALRTTVSILTANRFPLLLWWGPQYIQIYNDAYSPILGAKHPDRALGQPVSECWSEVWHVIGPLIDTPFRGGPATWMDDILLEIDRHGFVEESHFTIAYSSVPDETAPNGIGGVLATVHEITQKVVQERRVLALRDLGARLMGAKSADDACRSAAQALAAHAEDVPFALFYLFDGEGNKAYLAGSCGVEAGDVFSPHSIDLRASDAGWPFAEVQRSEIGQVVPNLAARFGATRIGPWSDSPDTAVVLPLRSNKVHEPAGLLIAGLSSRLKLDDFYQSFLEFAAAQVATSIANARAFEEEKKRVDALAEIDRAKTLFFSNVSHEFRTPLTLMSGALDEISQALAENNAARALESVSAAHRNTGRLLRLVNNLLDFSRISAARADPRFAPTDLSAFTAELASSFRSACERVGLDLSVDCRPIGQPTYVDREMWEKVVLNLLSNAVKFTFDGFIKVSMHLADDQRSVQLDVCDTGTGIPKEEMPRVFERFHRVVSAKGRSVEGSGIGLALVNELVSLHGGTVSVKSEPNNGSTFTVRIPLGTAHLCKEQIVEGSTDRAAVPATNPYVTEALQWTSPSDASAKISGDPETHRATSGSVLVADDNRDMREYLTRLLSDYWRVIAVPDGQAALQTVREQAPDVVLADVMMPNLDGVGLLRALRADQSTAAIPIVLLSARAGEEARIDGLRQGADDYLIKPFSARELIARVQTQMTRSRVRAAQNARDRRLAEVFRNAPVSIGFLRGPEHVFEFVNDEYRRLFFERDVLGKTVRDALPELKGQGIYELLDRVYQSGEAYFGRSLQMLLRDPNGPVGERYFDFVYQPLSGTDGEGGVAVVAFDVTELALARREAESANRAKDTFLAMLGHELRNPLAPIVTTLHIMSLRGQGTMEQERAVITRQVDHMVRLVDDLLDVSRVARGKIELRKEPVELADVVAKAIETAGPLIEERRHNLVLDIPATGLMIDADAGRLTQVVSNLLTNAAKYTQIAGTIRVNATRSDHDVVLRVIDNGVGIAPEMLPRVFEMFTQAEQSSARAQGGLGLGLTIARALAERHRGELSVESAGLGKGSTFILRVPAAQGALIHKETPTVAMLPVRAPDAASPRILIVDDNEDAANGLAQVLALRGYPTSVAYDGPSALKLAEDFAPDIALLDIGLPVMDGHELARRLRKNRTSANVKLIAVTGYGQKVDRERSRKAGFHAHLVKPVNLDALKEIMDSVSEGIRNR